jgi:uncharacterized protein (UPF0335 family)
MFETVKKSEGTMISNSQIATVVERIERMEDEKSAISLDISELYKEAKGNGFDVKILRKVIAARKKPQNQRDSENAIFDLYMSAVGFEQTPLGKYSEGTE